MFVSCCVFAHLIECIVLMDGIDLTDIIDLMEFIDLIDQMEFIDFMDSPDFKRLWIVWIQHVFPLHLPHPLQNKAIFVCLTVIAMRDTSYPDYLLKDQPSRERVTKTSSMNFP